MTIEELKDYLLINSFQYFIGADDIEVTDEVLNGLVKRALNNYINWRPLRVQEDILADNYVTEIKFDSKNRRILDIIALYFFSPILSGEQGKVDWDWDYEKDSGRFRTEVTGSYIAEMLVLPTLEDLDETHPEFLDLVQGLYMMYVGAQRKSFSFGDQPFENDGADLYSDGKELYENTLEKIKGEQDNWYYAIL